MILVEEMDESCHPSNWTIRCKYPKFASTGLHLGCTEKQNVADEWNLFEREEEDGRYDIQLRV